MATNPSSLLATCVKARYIPRTNFLVAKIGQSPSFTCRSYLLLCWGAEFLPLIMNIPISPEAERCIFIDTFSTSWSLDDLALASEHSTKDPHFFMALFERYPSGICKSLPAWFRCHHLCPRCGQAQETIEHFLRDCPWSRVLWASCHAPSYFHSISDGNNFDEGLDHARHQKQVA